MEETRIMNEISIREYGNNDPDPAGAVLFLVAVKETLTHHYLVMSDGEGNPIKTAKQVRADFEEHHTDGWHKQDWTDCDSERISKVEKVVYSPCSLALQYLTPPQEWLDKEHPKHERTRYLNQSTMFDEQPESAKTRPSFTDKAIRRRYDRCTNYIKGKTSQICPQCLRRIKEGWSIITPLKKEESE